MSTTLFGRFFGVFPSWKEFRKIGESLQSWKEFPAKPDDGRILGRAELEGIWKKVRKKLEGIYKNW